MTHRATLHHDPGYLMDYLGRVLRPQIGRGEPSMAGDDESAQDGSGSAGVRLRTMIRACLQPVQDDPLGVVYDRPVDWVAP